MPRFSAFAAFSHLRFSAKPPVSQQLYEQMVANLGGGENFSDDFDSIVAAELYANAMAMARAAGTLERAGNQWRPDRALEGLLTLESEVSRVPEVGESIAERRRQVSARLKIPRGASYQNVVSVFRDVLGDGFVDYKLTPIADAVYHSSTAQRTGTFVAPGSRKGLFRLKQSIIFLLTPVTVEYEKLAGDDLQVGDKFVIGTSSDRLRSLEVLGLSSDSGKTFLTTESLRPQEQGALFISGRHPVQVSSRRHSLILVTESVMQSTRLLRLAHETAQRVFRGVSTWSVASEEGPFRVGVGRLGVTCIGQES